MIQQSQHHSDSALALLSEFRRKLWTVERQTEEN
jgi:hypothetical protein